MNPALVSPVQMYLSLPDEAARRLIALSGLFALGSFLWGYNIGILATIYVNPGFIEALNRPTAAQKGLITAIYYLGTWTSYVFLSGRISDRLGRRYAALVGTLVTCLGAAIQCGSRGKVALATMCIGRVVNGVGNAIISTSVPMYQSEIAPAKKRGGLVVMNHVGMVAGLATAFWAGYGVSHWKGHLGSTDGWRFSIAFQFIPAVIFMIGLPLVPETLLLRPRWLLEKGHIMEATRTLYYLRGTHHPDAVTTNELNGIRANIDMHNLTSQSTYCALLKSPPLRQRLWRGALLQFMGQICGATAIKYYLPTVFLALGLSKDLSLMAGGIESTLKIGCTVIEIFLVDRLGRKVTMVGGGLLMSISMLINAALPLIYPSNRSSVAEAICIVFIFLFSFGYSLGLGPNAWVYSVEIFPTYMRARGLNLCASAGAVGSILIGQIFPIAIERLGSRTYFVFFAINLCSVVILTLFYPETKKRSLEDLDYLFSKGIDGAAGGVYQARVDSASGIKRGEDNRGREEELPIITEDGGAEVSTGYGTIQDA